jgi:hypothetical protein
MTTTKNHLAAQIAQLSDYRLEVLAAEIVALDREAAEGLKAELEMALGRKAPK